MNWHVRCHKITLETIKPCFTAFFQFDSLFWFHIWITFIELEKSTQFFFKQIQNNAQFPCTKNHTCTAAMPIFHSNHVSIKWIDEIKPINSIHLEIAECRTKSTSTDFFVSFILSIQQEKKPSIMKSTKPKKQNPKPKNAHKMPKWIS